MARLSLEINNLTEAISLFTKEIGGRLVRLEQGSKGPMCAVLADGHGNRAYLFFKRDWLHSYGKLFPDEEWKGFGQTLNLKILERAAYDAAWIIVILPNAAIYKCWGPDWLNYARKHNTIRIPSTEFGQEASIPTTMLERVTFSI